MSVHVEADRPVLHPPLSCLEERMDPSRFVRTHGAHLRARLAEVVRCYEMLRASSRT